MNKRKSSKIILVMLGASIVIVFGLCYFVYKDIESKNINYHATFSDLSFQNNKEEYLFSKQKTLDDISLDIGRVDSSIISKDGDIDFIRELELLAKNNNLSIEIVSLALDDNAKLASSTISILKIKAETNGSWHDNYMFLSRLESLSYKVRINTAGLSTVFADGSPSANKNKKWQGLFEIDVLKYK